MPYPTIHLKLNFIYKKLTSSFQTELLNIIRLIGKCNNLIVHLDKTPNFYEILVNDYGTLLKHNITKDYEKCDDKILNKVNLKCKNLIKSLKIHDIIKMFPINTLT